MSDINPKDLNGVGAGETVESLAKRHKVSVQHIKIQLRQGIEVEREHTDKTEVARKIAMDHLYEDPDYYTKLEEMEDEDKDKKKDIKESATLTFLKSRARQLDESKSCGCKHDVETQEEEMKNDPCWKGYKMIGTKDKNGKTVPNCVPTEEVTNEEKTAAWQRKEGKNPDGGLNEKGRKSYEKTHHGSNLKPPVKESNPKGERKKRQDSFCARMKGMKKKLTSEKTKNDPDSRINKSLRAWNC